MGFNYGLEKKNFDRQWAIMRKQYEDAGMSIEVIQAMYEYDWSVFNATRSYQNHTQEIAAPSFEQGEEAYSPLMNKYKQYDPENFAAYPARFSGPFLLITQSILRAAFPALSICLAIMFSSSCVIVAQFATR